jgi:hypothetical protein
MFVALATDAGADVTFNAGSNSFPSERLTDCVDHAIDTRVLKARMVPVNDLFLQFFRNPNFVFESCNLSPVDDNCAKVGVVFPMS